MNPQVFIVQRNQNLAYEDATRFGVLDTLYERDAFPDDAEERTKKMAYIARSKLANFNPETDHILLSGDPIAIATVMLILGEDHDQIPVLKWDRENKKYYSVLLNPSYHYHKPNGNR